MRKVVKMLAVLGILYSNLLGQDSLFIGGFDESRGGRLSFPEGQGFSQARSSVLANFSGVSFTSFDSVTVAALAGIDIVVLSSGVTTSSHIWPLSIAEQDVLFVFAEGGGSVILLLDNDGFGGTGTPAANESLLDPFGMDIQGTLMGRKTATVIDTSTSPITQGQFGTVSTFSQNWPGGLTNLGQYAVPLATNSIGVALAVINKDTISNGSGKVVVYSDLNTFSNSGEGGYFPENENLLLNTISFCKETALTTIYESLGNLPEEFVLYQNYPNPFNPVTTINYWLSKRSHVELVIYNLLGKQVRTLLNQQQMSGKYQVKWDGRDDQGNDLSSGMYFYRITYTPLSSPLEGGLRRVSESRKMMLLR